MAEDIKMDDRPGGTSTSSNQSLPEQVRNLNLGPISFKLMQASALVDWTPDQVKLVEEEYRKFLALRIFYPNEVIVPDAPIDTYWHQHIVDTEKYRNDCQALFGEFMDHFPYFGLRGNDDWNQLRDSFASTTEKYKAKFGEPPENMWRTMADCGRLGCAPGPATGAGGG